MNHFLAYLSIINMINKYPVLALFACGLLLIGLHALIKNMTTTAFVGLVIFGLYLYEINSKKR